MPTETSYMKKVGVDHRLIAFVEERAGHQVNRLVDAVGQDDLIGFDAKMLRDDALNGLALRIDRQAFCSELLQLREDARTRRERVLVEVEAQRVTAGERWMILRHRKHTCARLRENRRVVSIEFVYKRSCLVHYSLLTIH